MDEAAEVVEDGSNAIRDLKAQLAGVSRDNAALREENEGLAGVSRDNAALREENEGLAGVSRDNAALREENEGLRRRSVAVDHVPMSEMQEGLR